MLFRTLLIIDDGKRDMTLEEEIERLDKIFGDLVRKSPKNAADMEEMERMRILRMNALLQQGRPLADEVREVGIEIKSVWDFVNSDEKYPEAIPVLIKHLSRPYHRAIKEGIVRALAVKAAKGLANKAVIEEYQRLPREDLERPWIRDFRWAFGNTMSVIVTKDDLDELIKIVTDESNGESRTGFIEALAKIKSPKVIEVLHQLENDKNQIVADRAKKILAKKTKAAERKTKKKNP